jgi:hypothetical protein
MVSRRPLTCIPITFYHVNAREQPSIDFYGELPQDQSALLNSRLNILRVARPNKYEKQQDAN